MADWGWQYIQRQLGGRLGAYDPNYVPPLVLTQQGGLHVGECHMLSGNNSPAKVPNLKSLAAIQAEREVIAAAELIVDKNGFWPERDSEAEPMWRLKEAVAKLREARGQ